MSRRIATGEQELEFLSRLAEPTGRRSFLKWAGVGLAVTAAGCADNPAGLSEEATGTQLTGGASNPFSLGTGDIAVLNYAYALEQLEASFFTQVIAARNAGTLTLTARESLVLNDIRKHEVIHREFYRAALGEAAIPDLTFDFTGVDLSDRIAVLETSVIFEDLGVSAYNGAGQLLQNLDFLLVAGKIVSNEARHAAAVRSLLRPKTTFFADLVDEDGLDVFRVPSRVLELAGPFINEDLDPSGLPAPTVTENFEGTTTV